MAEQKIKSGGQLTKESKALIENPDATIKDYYNLLSDLNRYESKYKDRAFGLGGVLTEMPEARARLIAAMDAKFPNRGAGDIKGEKQALRSPRFEGFEQVPDGKGGLKIVPKEFEKSDVTEAIMMGKAKKALTDAEKAEEYDGPFGKFGKYLRDNEDKRSDFFNYLGAIGARLVEPTKPGEARSFVSDISQGLTRGKANIAAQDAAALDALVKKSEAAANIDPTQNYSSKMKEVRKEAISLGYEPGTKEYSDYVGAALRGMRVSAELEPLLDSLKIAKERAMINPDDEGNNNIIKNLENRILALQSGTPSGGSGTKTYKYQP